MPTCFPEVSSPDMMQCHQVGPSHLGVARVRGVIPTDGSGVQQAAVLEHIGEAGAVAALGGREGPGPIQRGRCAGLAGWSDSPAAAPPGGGTARANAGPFQAQVKGCTERGQGMVEGVWVRARGLGGQEDIRGFSRQVSGWWGPGWLQGGGQLWEKAGGRCRLWQPPGHRAGSAHPANQPVGPGAAARLAVHR